MRHRVHTFKIGRSSAHRRAMLANMINSLIEHGQISTTLVKAKEARRFAEKMITIGKKNDVHHRRLAVARLHSKAAVKKLFDEIAPQYQERQGGYTRILKLGKRQGDAAEMAILQLVEGKAAAAAPVQAEVKAEAAPVPEAVEAPAETPAPAAE